MSDHLTVIIPTRDRADVLKYTLATTLRLNDPNMTVIVSDNSSVDDTQKILQGFNDSRLKIIRTPERVSMRANWEFALSHVSDGWVTVIGDDDAILPGAHETVLNIAAETGVEAIRSYTAEYIWPGPVAAASLTLPLAKGYIVKNTLEELRRVMTGKQPYTMLPVLYNGGFIKVSALRRMAASTGLIFGSSIPDVYIGLSLCSVLDRYVLCKEPLAINGASRHSGGTAAMRSKTAATKVETDPFSKFVSENDVQFNQRIPLLSDGSIPASIHVFVFETFLTAQDRGVKFPYAIDFLQQYQIIREDFRKRGVLAHYEPWLKKFREINNINHNEKHLVNYNRYFKKSFSTVVDLAKRLDLHVAISGSNLDLSTVIEAVDYCVQMKSRPPNRLANGLLRLIDRLRKLF